MNLTPIPDPKPDALVVRKSQHEIGILRVFKDNLNHSWSGVWTSLHDAIKHLNRCRKDSWVFVFYRESPSHKWELEEGVNLNPETDYLTVTREPWIKADPNSDDPYLLFNNLKM